MRVLLNPSSLEPVSGRFLTGTFLMVVVVVVEEEVVVVVPQSG